MELRIRELQISCLPWPKLWALRNSQDNKCRIEQLALICLGKNSLEMFLAKGSRHPKSNQGISDSLLLVSLCLFLAQTYTAQGPRFGNPLRRHGIMFPLGSLKYIILPTGFHCVPKFENSSVCPVLQVDMGCRQMRNLQLQMMKIHYGQNLRLHS